MNKKHKFKITVSSVKREGIRLAKGTQWFSKLLNLGFLYSLVSCYFYSYALSFTYTFYIFLLYTTFIRQTFKKMEGESTDRSVWEQICNIQQTDHSYLINKAKKQSSTKPPLGNMISIFQLGGCCPPFGGCGIKTGFKAFEWILTNFCVLNQATQCSFQVHNQSRILKNQGLFSVFFRRTQAVAQESTVSHVDYRAAGRSLADPRQRQPEPRSSVSTELRKSCWTLIWAAYI